MNNSETNDSNKDATRSLYPPLWMAWRGSGGDSSIFWSRWNNDSITWYPYQRVPVGGTSFGPSLAFYRGVGLCMAWKGKGSDERIFFSMFRTNASAWTEQQQVPVGFTSSTPSLAAYGGDLWMAWKGKGSDNRVFLTKFNGTEWAEPRQGPGRGTPSLAARPRGGGTGEWLEMVWTEPSGDIYFAPFNGTQWYGPYYQSEHQGLADGPVSMVSLGYGDPYFKNLWTVGKRSDERIFIIRNSSRPREVPVGRTSSTPSLAVYGGDLWMAWKGKGGDERIFFTKFNGTALGVFHWELQWAEPRQGPGTGTSFRPVLASDQ